jgi:hypothetical protein
MRQRLSSVSSSAVTLDLQNEGGMGKLVIGPARILTLGYPLKAGHLVLSTALGEEKQTIFSTAAYVCLPRAVSPSPSPGTSTRR